MKIIEWIQRGFLTLISGGLHAISCALNSSGAWDEVEDVKSGAREGKEKVKKLFTKSKELDAPEYQI